jgi:hypothetical protein
VTVVFETVSVVVGFVAVVFPLIIQLSTFFFLKTLTPDNAQERGEARDPMGMKLKRKASAKVTRAWSAKAPSEAAGVCLTDSLQWRNPTAPLHAQG